MLTGSSSPVSLSLKTPTNYAIEDMVEFLEERASNFSPPTSLALHSPNLLMGSLSPAQLSRNSKLVHTTPSLNYSTASDTLSFTTYIYQSGEFMLYVLWSSITYWFLIMSCCVPWSLYRVELGIRWKIVSYLIGWMLASNADLDLP